jgi:putative oxidoreductase
MDYVAAPPRAIAPAAALLKRASDAIALLTPALDLAIRLYIANIFFRAGLTKIANWDSTLSLFENEYDVPLLPPELAAFLGTGAELFLPVFLALGLLARPAALALFVFNVVAVISYPDLSAAGSSDHWHWGFLIAVTMLHGPGKLSLDHLIRRRLFG